MTYKVPCGRTIGHGESCQEGDLCGGCHEVKRLRERIDGLMLAMVKLSGFSYSTEEKIAIAKKELGL